MTYFTPEELMPSPMSMNIIRQYAKLAVSAKRIMTETKRLAN